MKLLVSLKNKELDKYLDYTNSFLIGLKDYSVNQYEVSIVEIKEILTKYKNIELFISINKNIFNKDLEDLENKLVILSNLKIKGILFYDLSILSIVKRLNLNINLCLNQTHLVTNYNICNYYYNLGCKYAYLSTEITEEEMNEISKNVKIKLMTYFIGHPIISHSKRKLVSNYYQFINKKNTNKENIIKEKNGSSKYYIMESSKGTNILTFDILNGSKAFLKLKDKIEYGILDTNLIDDNIFLNILSLYKDKLNSKIADDYFLDNISNLIGNYDGFFYKKTIYKVKK